MLNRWIGILCAALMVTANATLFTRDILPKWLAGDPPEPDVLTLGTGVERRSQVSIVSADNQLVGRSWTISTRQGPYLAVSSTTMLHPVMLPEGIATPRVRIDTELRYRDEDGMLDELVMTLRGLPAAVVLRGEFWPPDVFACKWQIGQARQGAFRLDAEATKALGNALHPFRRLRNLYVGRTWRLHLLDPLTQVIPGLNTDNIIAEPEIVRVTGTDALRHRGQVVETFVVEAPRVRAWVAQDGTVLRQEVDVPLLGKLIIRDEPFKEDQYTDARLWPPVD